MASTKRKPEIKVSAIINRNSYCITVELAGRKMRRPCKRVRSGTFVSNDTWYDLFRKARLLGCKNLNHDSVMDFIQLIDELDVMCGDLSEDFADYREDGIF